MGPHSVRSRTPARLFPYATGIVEVQAAERLTPRMARITFGGGALASLPDEEPGEIVTFIWPAAGESSVVLPELRWRFPPGTPEQHARNYTIRSYDPEAATVAVDFVLHGAGGHGSRWAQAARPGDTLGFAGPRVHWYSDPTADWTLLAGDETALPSIAATLERLGAGHRVLAFVEVADAADVLDLRADADLHVTWLHRDGEDQGRSRKLEAAIRAADLPAGRPKVWVAGESLAVRGIREHLRDERELEIGPMQAIGYWKHRDSPVDDEE